MQPERILTPADFARLPLLTKADIRANLDDLIAPAARASILFKTTGGSTASRCASAIRAKATSGAVP